MGSKEKNFQHSEIERLLKTETKRKWCRIHKDNYSHTSKDWWMLKHEDTTKDVNEITTKNMIIKAFNEEKGQNIVNNKIKGNFTKPSIIIIWK